MFLLERLVVQFVVKGGFVEEDGRVLADADEGLAGPAVAAVGEFEAVGPGEGDGFGAVAVVDGDGLDVGAAHGGEDGFVAGGRVSG